jgi:hypothetical protein
MGRNGRMGRGQDGQTGRMGSNGLGVDGFRLTNRSHQADLPVTLLPYPTPPIQPRPVQAIQPIVPILPRPVSPVLPIQPFLRWS